MADRRTKAQLKEELRMVYEENDMLRLEVAKLRSDRAIYDATQAVEAAGCDVRLTHAVNKLAEAQRTDYVPVAANLLREALDAYDENDGSRSSEAISVIEAARKAVVILDDTRTDSAKGGGT